MEIQNSRRKKLARTRGVFDDLDPPLLVRGSSLPSSHRLEPRTSMKKFVSDCLENKSSIFRAKKGPVKKIMSRSLKNVKEADQTDTNQFCTQTAKAFSMTQSNLSSQLKKMTDKVRKNQTFLQKDETILCLGMDLFLLARLKAAESTRSSTSAESLPWLLDRNHLCHAVKTAQLGCRSCACKVLFAVCCMQTWTDLCLESGDQTNSIPEARLCCHAVFQTHILR